MSNLAQSLYDSIPAMLGGGLTGLCVVVAAIVTSKSITKLDRVSHKRKILNALEAEILGYTKKSPGFDPGSSLLAIYEKLQNEREHEIILSSELNNLVYKSLAQNFHVLPENVVGPVVDFYNTMYFIELALGTINGQKFTKLGTLQKMEIYYDYINLKVTALNLAEKALSEIQKAKS